MEIDESESENEKVLRSSSRASTSSSKVISNTSRTIPRPKSGIAIRKDPFYVN